MIPHALLVEIIVKHGAHSIIDIKLESNKPSEYL